MANDIRNKLITIFSYLLIWSFAMIVFWFFTGGSDAMGYTMISTIGMLIGSLWNKKRGHIGFF